MGIVASETNTENTILILKTDSWGRSAASYSMLAKTQSYIEHGVSHTNVSPAWFHPRCVSLTGNCLTIKQTGHAVLNWSSRWREITCNMQSGCGCCHTVRKWQWWKLCRPTVPYHSAFWTCSFEQWQWLTFKKSRQCVSTVQYRKQSWITNILKNISCIRQFIRNWIICTGSQNT